METERYPCLIEMITHFYDYIHSSFGEISDLIRIGVLKEDPDTSSLAQECWNSLIEIEKQRTDESTAHQGYVSALAETIIATLMQKLLQSEDHEDTMSYCSTIEGVSSIIRDKAMAMLPFLGAEILRPEILHKRCGLYVLGAILSGVSPANLQSILQQISGPLQSLAQSESAEIIEVVVWFLFKITEVWPQVAHQNPAVLEIIVQHCTGASAKTAVDALIEIADTGLRLPNTHELVQLLLHTAADKKMVNCFHAVRTIVEYLPRDDPVIIHYTSYLLASLSPSCTSLGPISNILRMCFERLSVQHLEPLLGPVFTLLNTLPFTEEFVIAVACISRHEVFLGYLNAYMGLICKALSTPELNKCGIICLGELARNIDTDFSQSLAAAVDCLFGILDYEALPNTHLVEAFSDLCSIHTSLILPRCNELLKYADYAMQKSLQSSEDTDYVQELQEVVVILFEGLVQGLSLAEELQAIAGSLQGVVRYCLEVSMEKYQPSDRLIGGALGVFVDVILAANGILYAEQVRALAEKYKDSEDDTVKANAKFVIEHL